MLGRSRGSQASLKLGALRNFQGVPGGPRNVELIGLRGVSEVSEGLTGYHEIIGGLWGASSN